MIHRWKDNFFLKIEKEKNEDIELTHLSFADSKSVFRFLIFFLDQKLQPFKEGLKRPKRAKVDPLLFHYIKSCIRFYLQKIWIEKMTENHIFEELKKFF